MIIVWLKILAIKDMNCRVSCIARLSTFESYFKYMDKNGTMR